MKEVLPYILALALLPVAASCSFEDEPGVCPYNVRLEYWYAGYATENRLPVRMDNLQEYLYDGGGRLVRTCDLRRDSLTGYHCTLVPGEYTVVATWIRAATGQPAYPPPIRSPLRRLPLCGIPSLRAGVRTPAACTTVRQRSLSPPPVSCPVASMCRTRMPRSR